MGKKVWVATVLTIILLNIFSIIIYAVDEPTKITSGVTFKKDSVSETLGGTLIRRAAYVDVTYTTNTGKSVSGSEALRRVGQAMIDGKSASMSDLQVIEQIEKGGDLAGTKTNDIIKQTNPIEGVQPNKMENGRLYKSGLFSDTEVIPGTVTVSANQVAEPVFEEEDNRVALNQDDTTQTSDVSVSEIKIDTGGAPATVDSSGCVCSSCPCSCGGTV